MKKIIFQQASISIAILIIFLVVFGIQGGWKLSGGERYAAAVVAAFATAFVAAFAIVAFVGADVAFVTAATGATAAFAAAGGAAIAFAAAGGAVVAAGVAIAFAAVATIAFAAFAVVSAFCVLDDDGEINKMFIVSLGVEVCLIVATILAVTFL